MFLMSAETSGIRFNLRFNIRFKYTFPLPIVQQPPEVVCHNATGLWLLENLIIHKFSINGNIKKKKG